MITYYVLRGDKIECFGQDRQKIVNSYLGEDVEILETQRPVENYEFADTAEYIEAQAQKEAERIARLKMTKLDFFKYVVAPTGTSYAQLFEAVGSNDLLKATWDLCNHVYRGDEVLNAYVTELLKVSSEQLDEVFKEYGD